MNHQQISTFLTAGNVKLMLLHSGKSEDSIKNFFNDVYELYVKVRDIQWELVPCINRNHWARNEEKSMFVVCELPRGHNLRELPLSLSHSPLESGLRYLQLLMNPFYAYDTPITSKAFDTRVRALARRYLP